MSNAIARAPDAPHRVLIVDDQPDVLYFLRLFREEAGFEVEQATNGRTAIAIATGDCRHDFEVVVLDVGMPDVDGVKVAMEIRACEACRRTRIIFHSALEEAQVRARFSAYDDYLRKPADVERLVERIKRLAATRSGHPFPNRRSSSAKVTLK